MKRYAKEALDAHNAEHGCDDWRWSTAPDGSLVYDLNGPWCPIRGHLMDAANEEWKALVIVPALFDSIRDAANSVP